MKVQTITVSTRNHIQLRNIIYPLMMNMTGKRTKSESTPLAHKGGMSEKALSEYTGITEDIVTDLSAVANLSVAARSSTQIYRSAPVRPDQISSELGVRYIVDGSVRKSGQSVRIAAQLIDGHTNRQIGRSGTTARWSVFLSCRVRSRPLSSAR